MLPIIQIGPLAIQTTGLIILLSIWLGISLAEKFAIQRGITTNILDNLVLIGLASGIIGARLIYVIKYIDIFLASPISIISLNPGLLDPFGGAVIAIISMVIYGRNKNLQFWTTLDTLTPFFAVMGIAIGLSHLTSGAAFGMETDIPWGFEIWGASRHPTQIYEIIAAVAILIIVWPGRTAWLKVESGVYFLSFVAMSAGARLFLEAFRADSSIILGSFRSAQILAWIILATSLWGIVKISKTNKNEDSQELAKQK